MNDTTTHETDFLRRFLFEQGNVRGIFVRLGASYEAMGQRYDYPAPVARQLGQAASAAALLGATIKFEGALVMQIESQGPIRLLVVQSDHQRHLRGLARWEGEVPEAGDLAALYGAGRLVITIDNQASGERYQGIVGLEGAGLAQALERYFEQSEQLETRLFLAADGERAAGLLLQHLPGEGESDDDLWRRIETLGATVTDEELLHLPVETLLHRLFHEEQVRLFDPEPVSFRCSCSREKIAALLEGLGRGEAERILEQEGEIEVGCDFCNQRYRFDAVDVEQLFARHPRGPESSTRH